MSRKEHWTRANTCQQVGIWFAILVTVGIFLGWPARRPEVGFQGSPSRPFPAATPSKLCYNLSMGYPIPPPPVIGDNCAVGDDILWLPGKTPRFIHVELVDLVPCPGAPLESPNAIFVLVQDPLVPCHWDYTDSKFHVYVDLTQAQAECGVTGVPPLQMWEYFFSQIPHGQSDFANWQLACDGVIAAIDGTAHVEWE